MKILKRAIPSFLVLLVVCAMASVGFFKDEEVTVASSRVAPQKIIIDAGHGGMDGGAEAIDGTIEKDINLKIALKLKALLELGGFDVIMTRTQDISTNSGDKFNKRDDLNNRLNLMKKNADAIFVSIHLNKFTTSAAFGAQVFYSGNAKYSKELGNSIQSSIINMLQPDNKRVIKMNNESTYILKNATVPAVIVECGFLSNAQELELLKREEYQNKMAFCIAAGIMEFQI